MKMFKGLALAAGLGAILLTLLGCRGPTDAEVEGAERAVSSRVVAAGSAIRDCRARAEHAYRSHHDAGLGTARFDSAQAAEAIEQADLAQAAAERAMAQAEREREEVEEAGRGVILASEGGRQFSVETQSNPDEVDAASQRVEAARAGAERAGVEAEQVRAEATMAPPLQEAQIRADAAYRTLLELRDLEVRYASELNGLMASLEDQVSNREVMTAITEINGVLDELSDDLFDLGCPT